MMRNIVCIALFFAPLFCFGETLSGQVVGVVDGDTVDILTSAREHVRIRLAGIDAPEKAQPYGMRAKQTMSSLVFGKDAQVEFDKRDRYGRIVGKVTVKGRDASLALIDAGLAWHFKKYAHEQHPEDQTAYADAEIKARQGHKGLWKDQSPIAPWDWRRGER